jgi:MOSC domain-containing protein
MVVGRVTEIWRYPVKSMSGERLPACTLGPRGIPGDRGWAVRDEVAGEIRGAKKLPQLLLCAARYVSEPGGGPVPPAEITLPDGTRVRSDRPEAAERLAALVGRRVTVWPLRPAEDTGHYQRGLPDKPDLEAELRDVFGRLPDEPLPDLSTIPQELFVYTSIPGTYFDVLPVHLVTTATLATLKRANPSSRFDVRRFRPNFVVEPEGEATDGFVENDWSGRRIRIGGATVNVEMPTARCVMTTLPQADLPKDPGVLRTIVHDAGQNVGMYASVADAGRVAVGDRVELA